MLSDNSNHYENYIVLDTKIELSAENGGNIQSREI